MQQAAAGRRSVVPSRVSVQVWDGVGLDVRRSIADSMAGESLRQLTGVILRPIAPRKVEGALRRPQSARKAALPQNCLTADKIVPLFWIFVNMSLMINQQDYSLDTNTE